MQIRKTAYQAPDDGGAGAPPAAPGAAPPAAPPAAPGAAPPAAPPAAPIGIFDAAGAADATTPPAVGADGKPTRPAWLGEQFWDAAAGAPKLESLARSQADLRARIARGEGTLPEAPEGYALPAVEGVPGDIIPTDDAIWGEVRSAAHKAGVTQAQMDALLRPYLTHAARIRAELAPPDAAASQAAHAQALQVEIGKLGANGPHMVRELGGWLAGMEARGSLTAEEAQSLRAIADAPGVRALIKLRELGGERPIPVDSLDAGGGMTEADARRVLIEGFAKKDDALLAKGKRALEDLQRRGQLAPR